MTNAIRQAAITFLAIIICISCNKPANKKVLVIGKGEIVVTDNKVVEKDKAGYTEQTVDVADEKEVSWNVETPSGKTVVKVPAGSGFYILNLRVDTLVGSKQNINKDLNGSRTITQEGLKGMIDSLTKLTTGANVSAGGNSYMIAPNQITKVSSSTSARVFGPFTKIPGSLEADKDGKLPEIYKFYTNTEMRQLIKNFTNMTK